jgi:2-methylcitrate dehydratase PrpD
MPSSSLTGQLADHFADLGCAALPETVRTHAQFLILDALGCGLVGATTDEAEMLRRTARAMAGGGEGQSRMWGTDQTAPLPLSVMANSVAVHTREIDDFSLAYHAGSVVVPAAVGVAAEVGATGAELLAAVAAGYEVSFRIAQGGAAEGQPGFLPFKKKGWHSTSLFGPFGAAVAAAKLLKLDARGLQAALGIAGSMASGTWAFLDEGNTIKRVHPGLAAKSGVIAAYLAREGITGPSRILEADWGGFYNCHLPGEPVYPDHVTGNLGSDWQILHAGFKPYASCRRIHSSLDALFEMVRKHDLTVGDVQAITVHGHALHKRQLSKFPVSTVLEAQFSLPYTLSAALTDGSGGLDLYRIDQLDRPEVARLARRVTVVIDPALAETGEPRVEFTLTDGRTVSETVHVPKGHPKNPLSVDELWTKFRTNAGLVYGDAHTAQLTEVLGDLAALPDVRQLSDLLAAPAAQS